MFTGLITDVGTVLTREQRGDLLLRIATRYDPDGIEIGASIACDGICLTVTDCGATDAADGFGRRGWFEVMLSAETTARSTARDWTEGRTINLERALRVGDELGGHIVAGHVDGVATVAKVTDEGDSTRVTLEAPEPLARFIAPKGSVALNGTSLTVNEVDGRQFGINFIPHTKAVTNWGSVAEGDRVNLEIDTLARYVARLQEWEAV